mmetsp:Transcript_88350/g.229217  ORF Transcript_88350/g.229217 Transcript_88350/m.229217 type:complete len:259 (+) Transcript_88350:267-1043(+)
MDQFLMVSSQSAAVRLAAAAGAGPRGGPTAAKARAAPTCCQLSWQCSRGCHYWRHRRHGCPSTGYPPLVLLLLLRPNCCLCLTIARKELANKRTGRSTQELNDVRPVRACILPHELRGLIEDFASEVSHSEDSAWILTRPTESWVLAANDGDRVSQAFIAFFIGLIKATPGSVVDHTEQTWRSIRLTLKQRKRGKLQSSHHPPPLAITIETLCLILFRLACEDLAVEKLLHSLIAIVYEELLEAVGIEHLEAVQVQEP